MIFSNSYVRSFTCCVLIFFGAIGLGFERRGLDFWSGRKGSLTLALLGIALIITGVFVGTISRRSEKPWNWTKLGMWCFGCWLVTIFLMALVAGVFIELHWV